MKNLFLLILFVTLLVSNMFLPVRIGSKTKTLVSLEIIQAMADEDPENGNTDPGDWFYPNREIPPIGLPKYIIYGPSDNIYFINQQNPPSL